MARIRSIHPGLWTDEAFMALSAHARLLLIGIWTEAFDDGVFEWKPLTLKARIFPVDSVDVPELLAELISANLIARAEQHPRQPGLIRNFQKFQRPKKPNNSGMLPDEWKDYVGQRDHVSEPVPNQSPTIPEKSSQMEDGGWKRSAEAVASDAVGVEPRDAVWTEGVSLLKAMTGKTDGAARSMVGKWLKASADDCALVLDKIRTARRERIGDPVAWVTAAITPPAQPPPKPRNAGVLARQQLLGLNDAPRSEIGHYLEGDTGPDVAGPGVARRFAIAAGR